MDKQRFLGITVFGQIAILVGLLFLVSQWWLWINISSVLGRVVLGVLGVSTLAGFALITASRNVVTRVVVQTGFVWSVAQFIASAYYGVAYLVSAWFVIPDLAVWGAVALTCLYGWLRARHALTRYEVVKAGVDRKYRIVQISDVHLGDIWGECDLQRIVRRVKGYDPDVVVITGDIVDGMETVSDAVFEPLRSLEVPTYFVSGNHDGYTDRSVVLDQLEAVGVTVLDNARVEHGDMTIIGVGYEDRDVDIVGDDEMVSVVLQHEPVYEDGVLRGDIVLAGHLHDGQVWPLGWLARLEFPVVAGRHDVDGTTVIVSRGTRTWGPPFRLGTNSELVVIDVVPDT